jgi:hypothetical protein
LPFQIANGRIIHLSFANDHLLQMSLKAHVALVGNTVFFQQRVGSNFLTCLVWHYQSEVVRKKLVFLTTYCLTENDTLARPLPQIGLCKEWMLKSTNQVSHKVGIFEARGYPWTDDT